MDGGVIALWMLNADYADMTKAEIERQIEGLRAAGYAGAMPCAWGSPGFLSERYFEAMGDMLSALRARGMTCVLWDEDRYPSGRTGWKLPEKYRGRALVRSVFRAGETPAPEGEFVAALLFSGGETRVLTEAQAAETVAEGDVLEVYSRSEECCNGFVDYLDREAVKAFIDLNYQPYYDRFAEYFGSTVKGMFFDEPSMYHLGEGRVIPRDFAAEFEREYGYPFALACPALFGEEVEGCAVMRRDFFRLRARMFADRYAGTLAEWCEAHGVASMGHFDQEEIANPSRVNGDLLGLFGRQTVPGADEIWNYGRSKTVYKMLSSARLNYGKKAVAVEVFGAMGAGMPGEVLFKEALDIFQRGINVVMPHGAWFDSTPAAVNAPPVLSPENPTYADLLPDFCRLCGDLYGAVGNLCPQADIAVYYPLDTLHADARFNEKSAYLGEMNEYPASYYEVGEHIFSRLRRDFFFLHPDNFLLSRAEEGEIAFDREGGVTRFRTVVFPDLYAARAETLRQAKRLMDGGIKLLFVGKTPRVSADREMTDGEIAALAAEALSHPNARYVESRMHWTFADRLKECAAAEVELRTEFDFALGDFTLTRWEGGTYLLVNSSDYAAEGELVASSGKTVSVALPPRSWKKFTSEDFAR